MARTLFVGGAALDVLAAVALAIAGLHTLRVAWPFPVVAFLVLLLVSSFFTFREERRKVATELPDIHFGEAEESDERVDAPHTNAPTSVRLYRIPITNEGATADSVSVQLLRVDPPPPAGRYPAVLHKMGDNPTDRLSHKEYFRLLKGEPAKIDVISITRQGPPYRVFLHKIRYVGGIEETQLSGEHVFFIEAFADNSPRPCEYLVRVDPVSGQLDMKQAARGSKAHPRP